MPTRPKAHTPDGKPPRKPSPPKDRGTAAARGYNRQWRNYRLGYLARHPLCAACLNAGTTTEATVVDHVVPHRGDQASFWDSLNHQGLCVPCHNAKTARGQ